jgi:PST family polysaccharide transporter
VKSILRATAILSGSSVVSILVGLVSAKAFSALLGPSGVGYMGLLQALIGLAGLLAGMGIGAGLVRMGAEALAREDHRQVAALCRAVWLLLWILGGGAALVLLVFRVPISQWMLGGPEHAWSVVLMGLALIFNLASGLQTSLLNTYHRVGALARIGVVNSILGTAISLALVWRWHERGIAPAIIVGALVGLGISTYYLRREIRPEAVPPARGEVARNAWALLRFGMPYTASMLVGTGVQFLLPALVLHMLGGDSVGFHRAALSVSGVYLGFLLTAMAYDYYPRVSAASGQPAELVHLVNQQHRLVMLLAGPMILGALALAPYLVPLIYTSTFSPAVEILEWQLIGDLFKFSSWTMGFVVLVRSGSTTLFLVELVSGVNTLAGSWVGMHFFGLPGLGIGFLATYVVHYLVVWVIVRRDIGLVWTLSNVAMMLGATLIAVLIRSLPGVGLARVRMPLALALAVIVGLGSLCVIWREIGGMQLVRTWRNDTKTIWAAKRRGWSDAR